MCCCVTHCPFVGIGKVVERTPTISNSYVINNPTIAPYPSNPLISHNPPPSLLHPAPPPPPLNEGRPVFILSYSILYNVLAILIYLFLAAKYGPFLTRRANVSQLPGLWVG